MTQRIKETPDDRRDRMDYRRREQLSRTTRAMAISDKIAVFVKYHRDMNRRNGVGRPPRNKEWPKGHPKRGDQ